MGQKNTHQPILFALNSNKPLAEQIAKVSGMPIGKSTINHFSDGEIKISIDESIRGDDVYIVQSLSNPVNDNLMELLIMIDAVRRTSSHTINVVIPYYGYSRSDRKAKSREPITAKLIAAFLESSEVDRAVVLDLHSAQIQGFFDIPVDHLQPDKLISEYLKKNKIDKDAVVVAPDHNGVARARKVADRLDLPIAIVDNRQPDKKDHIIDSVIGEVRGKNAIIVDDMIVTGHKMKVSADALKKAGAKDIYAVTTHPVFSEDVIKNLNDKNIKKVIVTDSVVIPEKYKLNKVSVIFVGNLIGKALKLIQENKSTHVLF